MTNFDGFLSLFEGPGGSLFWVILAPDSQIGAIMLILLIIFVVLQESAKIMQSFVKKVVFWEVVCIAQV